MSSQTGSEVGGMSLTWRDHHEELVFRCRGIIQHGQCLSLRDVGRVFSREPLGTALAIAPDRVVVEVPNTPSILGPWVMRDRAHSRERIDQKATHRPRARVQPIRQMPLLEPIEQLADVVRPDARCLDPDREILVVQALFEELGPPTVGQRTGRDIRVVGRATGEEVRAGRTAPRHRAEVFVVEDALVGDESVDLRHDGHGVEEHVCGVC